MVSKARSTTPVPKAKADPRKSATVTAKEKGDRKLVTAGIKDDVKRAGFIRKVYGLLSVQMVITVIVAGICMHVPMLQSLFLAVAQTQSWMVRLAFFLPTFGSLLMLKVFKNNYPANYILLFIFTLAISSQVGFVCSVFQSMGQGYLVLEAAAATAVIFLGLSLYAAYSGKDFSSMGGFLAMMLWGLVIMGFGAIFFSWLREGLLIGFIGALTFCGYILYDTWRIQKQFGYDDYIGATIEIYLDIINLFLYILEILFTLSKDKKKDRK